MLIFVIVKEKLICPSTRLYFKAHLKLSSSWSSSSPSVRSTGDGLCVRPQISATPQANLLDQTEHKQGCTGPPALLCAS